MEDNKILKIYANGKYLQAKYIIKPQSESDSNKCREVLYQMDKEEILKTIPSIIANKVNDILLEKGINIKITTIKHQLSIYRKKLKEEKNSNTQST